MTKLKTGSRRGAVMIEAALLLPLFLIFWFGIVDWGITFWVHQTIVHRANLAARWGIVNTFDPIPIQNLVIYGNTTGAGGALFGLNAGKVGVTLRCLTSSTPSSPLDTLDSGAPCLAAEWSDSRWIEIVVHDYHWRHFTPYFFGSYTGRTVTVTLPAESLGVS